MMGSNDILEHDPVMNRVSGCGHGDHGNLVLTLRCDVQMSCRWLTARIHYHLVCP